ncbi:GtrA family protein [Moritella sp. 24]|uniref:GtrA family protein n=1 Tax=Moritella sp. 24 TaxID=2746230 RepID=UPI001BAC2868|nr:GtrA family protein [Moritella sp. 24]QUM76618.1 GtrA family protein [Moritella sp. 24]
MNNKYIKFACVGGIGFVVDLTAMILFSTLFPLFIARLLAFFLAVNSNWLLNRNFTFKAKQAERESSLFQEWSKFLCSSCFGAIPNLLCYWLLVSGFSLTGNLAVIAIIPGIVFGMLINYLLADRWVFNRS